MTEPKSSDIRRRSFLAWCGGAGLGSTLFPGTLWAQSDGGSNAITNNMIDSAARLAGLEFSEADREEMVAGINANLQGIVARRAVYIDQNIPPPLYFNPAVPGQVFNHNREPFVRSARPSVRRPANLDDVAFWPVTDLSSLVESRQVSSLELTQMYLGRIKRHDGILNSVTRLTEELGIAQAKQADAEIANGKYRGPLHGIPWGAKDVIAKRGYKTTWGSEAYRDQIVDIDATAVTRLEDAGAVLIAKLVTGEIARGDHSLGKQTRNPWKTDEGSGGSSAGPGSATAAGLVGFSMGSDTTGSILGPSRTCGVSGLRPTFGRISRHGVMPVCWSLDKIGPICRSVEDCALVLEAVRGPDLKDLAVVDMPFNWNGDRSIAGLRIGFLEDVFTANGATNDNATLATLENLGVELTPIKLPEHADMDALQMLLVDEAAAFDELVQTGRIELIDPGQRRTRGHVNAHCAASAGRRIYANSALAYADDAEHGKGDARCRRLRCAPHRHAEYTHDQSYRPPRDQRSKTASIKKADQPEFFSSGNSTVKPHSWQWRRNIRMRTTFTLLIPP